jgi:hypothetical protein
LHGDRSRRGSYSFDIDSGKPAVRRCASATRAAEKACGIGITSLVPVPVMLLAHIGSHSSGSRREESPANRPSNSPRSPCGVHADRHGGSAPRSRFVYPSPTPAKISPPHPLKRVRPKSIEKYREKASLPFWKNKNRSLQAEWRRGADVCATGLRAVGGLKHRAVAYIAHNRKYT